MQIKVNFEGEPNSNIATARWHIITFAHYCYASFVFPHELIEQLMKTMEFASNWLKKLRYRYERTQQSIIEGRDFSILGPPRKKSSLLKDNEMIFAFISIVKVLI